MIIYSVLMFAMAVVMMVVSMLIYGGKTELIHSYHQTRVKDKKAYGKAMGKALSVTSIPLTVAGIIALFTTSALPTMILVVGLTVSFIPLLVVQKKYNDGIF